MEKAVKKEVEDVMLQPTVKGVLVADTDGLCVCAQGNASRDSAGLLSSVASQAAALRPDSAPVVVIETDAGATFVKSHAGITTAIYKSGTMRQDLVSVAAVELPR